MARMQHFDGIESKRGERAHAVRCRVFAGMRPHRDSARLMYQRDSVCHVESRLLNKCGTPPTQPLVEGLAKILGPSASHHRARDMRTTDCTTSRLSLIH